jgi:hypothetical protein
MTITSELLDKKSALVAQQRDQHFALYHQALGALGVIEHLKTLAKDHLTLEEFGEAVGGKVEAIEPV